MDRSEFLVESPPKPPRKVRRRPLSMREKGVDVVCRNGLFVLPKDALNNNPMALGICQFSVELYNTIADLKIMKRSCESTVAGSVGPTRSALQGMCSRLNKTIGDLIKLGHKYRQYILDVEDGKPVNEPKNWSRD